MPAAILGRKIGMTRLYDDGGMNIPVTVIQVGPCIVSQLKTAQADGYEAVQIAFEDVKGRNSTFPLIGHDAKAGATPKRFHREFRLNDGEAASYELGQALTVEVFGEVKYVDVIGTSKGKGTAGVMKRYGFKGQLATHGVERKHRSPGAVSGRSSNLGTGKPKKGIRMGGRMGNERVTVRSLPIVGVDKEKNLLLVKGPVPGAKRGLLMIREAVRLYKGKAKHAKA
jgi:large subunit ribosomal protein L3